MDTRALTATLLVLLISPAVFGQPVSELFQYQGYSEAEYASHSTHSGYVTMSDGTKIAVDYFLPADGPEREAFPVIVQYTPYQRSTINPENGAVNDWSRSPDARLFLSHGYALLKADMRGTGASTGWLMDFMPELGKDGGELIDWIAAQPWCDGNVGMTGGSYLGWSQTATASHQPAALKCINPIVVPLEGYTGEIYPGGIYLQGFLKLWAGFMFYVQRSYYIPSQGLLPAKPAIDEDGDGDYHDEIPIDQNGNGTFLDDGAPSYADGETREDIYYKATKEHEKNLDYAAWAESMFYIDAKSPRGDTLSDNSPNAHLAPIMETGIPVYVMGGWFDGFARGVFELYETLRETNPSKILIFPGYHDVLGGPYYKHVGADRKAARAGIVVEQLRFFDRYLKGVENGIDTEPPIHFYAMNGEGWRAENEWPLARAKDIPFFFTEQNGLEREADPNAGADDYEADYTHDSSYGKNKANRWLSIGGQTPSALPVRTEKDKQCLVYTSAPMKEDMEVTGHPLVHLWVSSTAAYGDFFVYLEDVDPSGESVLVTEAQLRAGFAELYDNDLIASGAFDVKPELPWHGYKKEHYQDRPLAEGKVLELLIDFQPTSWVFKQGHRIRVAIAAADFPTYRLHPKLSPNNAPGDPGNTVPTIAVHRADPYPSRIVLPVVSD